MGNLCRSPIGEALLKDRFPQKKIYSAGIIAKPDQAADKIAIEVAKAHHLNLEMHRSSCLSAEDCSQADLILVMEKDQIKLVLDAFPQACGKVMLFGQWLNELEIPDPYKRSKEMFEHVYDLMEKSAWQWQAKI